MLQGVIFDLDGTLLDTLTDIASSANVALEANGRGVHPDERYREWVGRGVRHLMERAIEEGGGGDGDGDGDEEIVDRLVTAFYEVYAERLSQHTRPYSGVPTLLNALEIAGLRLAVLSNKPHELTRRCVAEILPRWNFEPVIGQREGVPRKPDPTSLRELLDAWELAPENVVFVGDTTVDIETAQAANVPALAVSWGFRGRDELEAAEPDALVDKPDEARRWLLSL